MSERRAGPEKVIAGADLTVTQGRPLTMERDERTSSIGPAGVMAMACTHRRPDATREAPSGDRNRDQLTTRKRCARPCGVAERLVVPTRSGNSDGGKGPQLKTNARSNKDRGIGDEPNNSIQCSEVADGVARKSEGSTQFSFLCAVRQGVTKGCSDLCLRTLRSQWRSGGSGRPNFRGHRKVQ